MAVLATAEVSEEGGHFGWVVVGGLLYDLQKLFKLYLTGTIVVDLVYHVLYLLNIISKSQPNQRILQLLQSNRAATIRIQRIKVRPQLLQLTKKNKVVNQDRHPNIAKYLLVLEVKMMLFAPVHHPAPRICLNNPASILPHFLAMPTALLQ